MQKMNRHVVLKVDQTLSGPDGGLWSATDGALSDSTEALLLVDYFFHTYFNTLKKTPWLIGSGPCGAGSLFSHVEKKFPP